MKILLASLIFLFTSFSFPQIPFWKHLDSTYNEFVNTMIIDKADNIFASFTPGRIYKSTDDGQSWIKMWDSTENTIVYSMVVDTSNNIFAATSTRTTGEFGFYIGKLIFSSNRGISWNSVDSGIGGDLIYTLIVNKINTFFAGCPNGKIYRSNDKGKAWSLVREVIIGDNIQCLAFDSNNNIFAGSFSGDTGHVYHTTNNGDLWNTLTPFGRSVYALAIDAGDTIYAGTYNGGIYRSINQGHNWVQVGLENLSISSILIVGTNIYASTYDSGIYKSSNGGQNWNTVNTGLNNLKVPILSIDSKGFIFAGTDGGIYRSTQSITGIENSYSKSPETFLLKQNHPNPFNPSTIISYELPYNSFVTLTVYNILGQQISQLVNTKQDAGYKQILFTGNDLPSGVYVYRIQAGSFIASKKMLLLK